MKRRGTATVLLLLSLACAPRPVSTPDSAPPPFGDAIDDAAWAALGERPSGAPVLPYGGAMRLREFWTLEPTQRSPRMRWAQSVTEKADASRRERNVDRPEMYLDAIRIAPLYLPAWTQAQRVLFDAGEIERTAALARQHARLAPDDDGMPDYFLGKCQAHFGQTDDAIASLQRAAGSKTTQNTDVHVALAYLQVQQGNLTAADSLARRHPDATLRAVIAAKRARAAGDLPTAADRLQQAAQHPDAPVGVWEELGSTYLFLGNNAAADEAFLSALQRDPGRIGPRIGRARVAHQQGEHEAAIDTLQAILTAHPERHVARFNLAVVLLESSRSMPEAAAAETALLQAVDAWARCIDAGFRVDDALWGRAEAQLLRGNLSEAQFDARDLIERSTDPAAARTRWARLLVSHGHGVTAAEALRSAVRHNEIDEAGRALMAQLQDPADAASLPLLREAFRNDPENAAVGMRLGVALLLEGELAEAEGVMRAVVKLRPDDPNAYQNLAAVLDRRKKYREAQTALEKAESLR